MSSLQRGAWEMRSTSRRLRGRALHWRSHSQVWYRRSFASNAQSTFRYFKPRANAARSRASAESLEVLAVDASALHRSQTLEALTGDGSQATVVVSKPVFACPECFKEFSQIGTRNRHLNAVHRKDKPHPCRECDKRFAQLNTLDLHVLSVHRREKRYPCVECRKDFAYANTLKQHMRDVHQSVRRFACDKCPKAFSQASNLKLHVLAVHHEANRAAPKATSTANRRSHRKSPLARINRNLSPKEREQPHVCTTCDKRFSQSTQLKQHAKFCGRERIFKCASCAHEAASKSDLSVHVLSSDQCYESGALSKIADVEPSFREATELKSATQAAVDKLRVLRTPSIGVAPLPRMTGPAILNPNCSQTFADCEDLLHNRLVHSTSPEAYANIVSDGMYKASTPLDEHYDGADALRPHRLPARTHFELRSSSDGILFPFSYYPKGLCSGDPIRLMTLDASFIAEPEYSLFYVATTPTHCGESFMTAYHSHVGVALRGSAEERLVDTFLERLDKFDNQILRFTKSSGDHPKASMSTKFYANGQRFPHRVALSVFGDFPYSSDSVEVHDGVKFGYAEKSVVCPAENCSVRCSSISTLKTHFGRRHSTERPLSCELCEKSFANKDALSAHERTHYQVKSHKCHLCDKTYAQKAGLIQHLSIVHRKEKPFSCDRCGMDFPYRASMLWHSATCEARSLNK